MKWFLVLSVAFNALTACGLKPRYDNHGLRSLEIRVEPELVGEFLGGDTEHLDVPGKVVIGDDAYTARISAAGSSTIHEPKKSLNVLLTNGNFNGSRNLRLATTIKDTSMLKALLAIELFNAAGIPSPVVEPVFVYLNDRVLGLYIYTEQIDADFFGRRQIDIAQWFEAKGDADFGPTFEGRINQAFGAKPDKNFEPMIGLNRILQNPDDGQFETDAFKYLERDNVTRFLAAAQLLNHRDGFNKNLYYYRLQSSDRMRLAPWDFDLTWETTDFPNPIPWESNRLFSRVALLPSVKVPKDALVNNLKSGAMSLTHVQSQINYWRDKIRAGYDADPYLGRAGFDIDTNAQRVYGEIAAWYLKVP